MGAVQKECGVLVDQSSGFEKTMGVKGGYSPPATASKCEKGGRALDDGIGLSTEDSGGGGSGGWGESSGTRPLVLSHL